MPAAPRPQTPTLRTAPSVVSEALRGHLEAGLLPNMRGPAAT